MRGHILVTGGAGYIGSHVTLALLQAGFDVVVLDNLSNSSSESLVRVAEIVGRSPVFVQGDVRDTEILKSIFNDFQVSAVLHFAGLKAVGESLLEPLSYYDNNVAGTVLLCRAMAAANVFTLVFSSSATVYGDPIKVPISEDQPVGGTTNPYGRSKYMVEQVLTDLAASDERWRLALLRYFNPVGAHESGKIGEDPCGVPNNLLPCIAQVALGKLPVLSIFGDDYPTVDGTGIRDYIHVMDLAEGHLRALDAIQSRSGQHVWNLGAGRGYSVFEMVHTFEVVSGQLVPYRILPRRSGDVATCYADSSKAERELCWKARRGLLEMIRDAWRWQLENPDGYQVGIGGK
jgi:UDP-glucose 4-epimerase